MKENTEKRFTGSNPGMGTFDARHADGGWCLFIKFPKGERFDRFELTWEEVIDQLKSLGFIN